MKKEIKFNNFYPTDKYTKNLQQLFADYDLFRQKHFSQQCLAHLNTHYKDSSLFLTHTATGALEMIALMLDLKPTDEIILPSYTFVSTANAFARQGAKLVFVDIEKDSLGLDPEQVKKAITPNTKAIICMHYAGHACQIGALKNIATENEVLLIEDAALCYGNFELGVQGDFGVISFDVTKHISATQGGLLLVNNSAYIERAKNIYHIGTNREEFNEGNVPYYEWVDVGSKFQMAETNAAILSAQFAEETLIFEKLRKVSQWYFDELNDFVEKHESFSIMPSALVENNLHEFYILVENHLCREKTASFLKEKGVPLLFHYIPLHDSVFAKERYSYIHENDMTTNISNRLLRLPFHAGLSKEDVAYICAALKEAYNE